AGVRQPRPVTTGADGSFQALLPPGSWHLLVNGPHPVYLPQQLPVDRVTAERVIEGYVTRTVKGGASEVETVARRFFYPDAAVALDLKAGGGARDVAVTLKRAPLLRGRVVGPDGKPLKNVRMVRRPVRPFESTGYTDAQMLLDLDSIRLRSTP